MKGLVIIVPFKARGHKTRLSGLLTATLRKEFAASMLHDLLSVLGSAGLLTNTLVVTPDRGVVKEVSRLGAEAALESVERGVNAAVELGLQAAGSPESAMVLPSDIPALRRGDLAELIALKSKGLSMVISPSASFNGTNAMLFSTSDKLPLSYDHDSFWNHLAGAARIGLKVGVYTGRGVLFDVDTPADFEALGRSRLPGKAAAFARRRLSSWKS